MQRLHEAAVGAQQLGGLLGERVADDDRLAAAEVEPGHGRLVGHAAGEVEHVAQGLGLAGVGVEAGAAEGRAAGGGVDRDDRSEAAALVGADDDLLVAVELGRTRRTATGVTVVTFLVLSRLGVICTISGSRQGWTCDWSRLHTPDLRPFSRIRTFQVSATKPGGTLLEEQRAPSHSTPKGSAVVTRPTETESLLTPAEVAAMFRVDPKTVTRWAKAGKLSAIRTLGGHRRYRESEVKELLGDVIPAQRSARD